MINNITGKTADGVLTAYLSGHIDSANAANLESALNELCDNQSCTNVIVDAEKLSYISSAGLRVLLRLRKRFAEMKVINVSPEVYEVFDITGFTEIMQIEKAYRSLTVEGCEVIGQGANGKVYRLDPDTIIKVYMNPDCLEDIHRERELARKAFVLGIPTAIPYDVVKVDGTYGSVFELLNAKSFSKLIKANPENIMEYISAYTDLLKKIHATEVGEGELPDMNEVAIGWVNDLKPQLPQEQWSKLFALVSAIPHSLGMLHGDYHTKNLMMQNDEVLLIDMDTLAAGNPIYEFAFMYNAYIGFEETLPKERVGEFLGLNYEYVHTIWDEVIKLYFGTDDEKRLREITEKAMVIAYTRILRRTLKRSPDTDEGKATIENCRKKLAEILPKIDNLAI